MEPKTKTIKIGFDYEQGTPGLYLYDAESSLVLVSEDVIPSEELKKKKN